MNKQVIIIVIFLIVLVAAVVAWVVFSKSGKVETPPQTSSNVTSMQGAGIGGEIFQKVQNPISNKLPESNVGNVNPLGGAYQNPFSQ